MTLQELRYLVAVADEENFARAAEVCHVGQPTLSTQIRKLEESLGVVLFDRSHRHAELTPIGEKIIVQARRTLDEAEKIRELARNGEDHTASSLRLGLFPTLGPYLVPHLLPELRDAYPDLRLFLREDLSANLLDRLHTGRLDAALLALPVNRNGLEAQELFREPFVVALPPEHPLTQKSQIQEKELESHCVLLLEEGHCLRDQALAICGSSRRDLREEFKATSLETLRQMVAAGLGCTLLPALACMPHMSSLAPGLIELRPFTPPYPSRTIGLLWRRGCPRESVVTALIDYIRVHLPDCVTPINIHQTTV